MLNIPVINNNNLRTKYSNNFAKNESISFGNKTIIPEKEWIRSVEKISNAIDFSARIVMRKVASQISEDKHIEAYREAIAMEENSPDFMYYFNSLAGGIAKNHPYEINTESCRISDIADSDEACIFIMNHNDRTQDIRSFAFFNTLLNREYSFRNKESICPRPKVVLNEAIIASMEPIQREAFEKMGAVGVDVGLLTADEKKNARVMIPLMKKFSKDRVNIFIFPEGKMCAFTGISLAQRFQTGVAEIVNAATKIKSRVKVVPLGFGYKRSFGFFTKLGSIHVGEPIYFKRSGNDVLVTRGNMDSPFADKDYVDFFDRAPQDDGFSVITSQGKPVEGKDVSDYIAGVMCENLRISELEAKNAISNERLKEKVPLYKMDLSTSEFERFTDDFPYYQSIYERGLSFFERRMKTSRYSSDSKVAEIERALASQGVTARFKRNIETAKLVQKGLEDVRNAGFDVPKYIFTLPYFDIFVTRCYSARFRGKQMQQSAPIFFSDKMGNSAPEIISQGYKDGVCSTDNPANFIHHECGHWLHFFDMLSLEEAQEIWKGANKEMIEREVSQMALKYNDGSEFVAEVFAGIVDGKKYNEHIMDIYTQLNGPLP